MAYRLFARRAKKAGLPPGSLVYLGNHDLPSASVTAIVYDDSRFIERQVTSLEEALALRSEGRFLWLNIDGLTDTGLIQRIGETFSIHPLALEDILNAEQRPKREQFDEFLLVIAKAIAWSPQSSEFDYEQVSIVLGKDYVLTFQEKPGDAFSSVRERFRSSVSRFRKTSPDYLMYALLDTLVDQYFLVLEHFGEELDIIENEIVSNPSQSSLSKLYELKRAALFFRRSIWPLREALGFLQYGESRLIRKSTLPFLRDVYSHTVEALDTIEIFREMLTSMLDVYLSSSSNRLNVVIKVLTIITTIFMPLTFIAGVYGMNFQAMPELSWRYGYPAVLIAMGLIAGAMILFFRSKRWL